MKLIIILKFNREVEKEEKYTEIIASEALLK